MKPLITEAEEKELLRKLVAYYERIYPGLTFKTHEETLSRQQIAEVYYTYPGEEASATFDEKVKAIKEAVKKRGYATPVIILRKMFARKDILLDGHRRLKAAWEEGWDWKAFVMVPSRELEFGIEKMVQGKIKDLWR